MLIHVSCAISLTKLLQFYMKFQVLLLVPFQVSHGIKQDANKEVKHRSNDSSLTFLLRISSKRMDFNNFFCLSRNRLSCSALVPCRERKHLDIWRVDTKAKRETKLKRKVNFHLPERNQRPPSWRPLGLITWPFAFAKSITNRWASSVRGSSTCGNQDGGWRRLWDREASCR